MPRLDHRGARQAGTPTPSPEDLLLRVLLVEINAVREGSGLPSRTLQEVLRTVDMVRHSSQRPAAEKGT